MRRSFQSHFFAEAAEAWIVPSRSTEERMSRRTPTLLACPEQPFGFSTPEKYQEESGYFRWRLDRSIGHTRYAQFAEEGLSWRIRVARRSGRSVGACNRWLLIAERQ